MQLPLTRRNLIYGLAIPLALMLTALLFVSGPGHHASRIVREIWESGHFFLFAALILIVLHQPFCQPLKTRDKFKLVLLVCVVLGIATETLQLLVGRNFQVKDLVNDIAGGMAGLVSHLFARRHPLWKNVLLGLLLLELTLFGLRGFVAAIVDEQNMKSHFPMLSDFESSLELDRWDTAWAKTSISEAHATHGQSSMKVEFFIGRYPDVTLDHFAADWRTYDALEFDVYNPSKTELTTVLKIYDQSHPERGYSFDDRFNQQLVFVSGENHFVIPLKKVKNAPDGRPMDMQAIAKVSLFTIDLKQPVVFYLDNVRLTKQVSPNH